MKILQMVVTKNELTFHWMTFLLICGYELSDPLGILNQIMKFTRSWTLSPPWSQAKTIWEKGRRTRVPTFEHCQRRSCGRRRYDPWSQRHECCESIQISHLRFYQRDGLSGTPYAMGRGLAVMEKSSPTPPLCLTTVAAKEPTGTWTRTSAQS